MYNDFTKCGNVCDTWFNKTFLKWVNTSEITYEYFEPYNIRSTVLGATFDTLV
jgi:hypothetical protein